MLRHAIRALIYLSAFVTANENLYGDDTAATANVQNEISSIDKRIAELKKIKQGYESKIIYHENQAEILQFTKNEQATAKWHLQIAEENRKIVKKIQSEIDELEQQKQKLKASQ